MSLVRNKAGLEKVEISNLQEISDLSARATISDGDSSVFLHCDNNGRLNVNSFSSGAIKGNDGDDGAGQDRTVKTEANGSVFVSNASFGHLNNISTNTSTTATNTTKISKGKDIVTDAGGLQQVLLYGKNGANGNLEPLETVGDRLLVDVLDLSPVGPSEPTALAGIGIYGQIGDSSSMKNLRVSTTGRLETSLITQIKAVSQYIDQSLAGSSLWSVKTNCSNYGKLNIIVNSNAITPLMVFGSLTENGTYLPFKRLDIINEDTGVGTHNIGNIEIEGPPNFVQIGNTDGGGVTLQIITTLSN